MYASTIAEVHISGIRTSTTTGTREPFFNSMPLWEAVEALSPSNIPVIVDCKHVNAWPVVESVVTELRPERCFVHSFASELKFDAGHADGEPDFVTEWSSIATLRELKRTFPSVNYYGKCEVAPRGHAHFAQAWPLARSDRQPA